MKYWRQKRVFRICFVTKQIAHNVSFERIRIKKTAITGPFEIGCQWSRREQFGLDHIPWTPSLVLSYCMRYAATHRTKRYFTHQGLLEFAPTYPLGDTGTAAGSDSDSDAELASHIHPDLILQHQNQLSLQHQAQVCTLTLLSSIPCAFKAHQRPRMVTKTLQ
jgi:hypothetical protein